MGDLVQEDEQRTETIIESLMQLNRIISAKVRFLENQVREKDARIAELQGSHQ